MAYPPSLPPNSRVNADPQFNNHPSDHNKIANALADIIIELGANPSYTYGSVEERLGVFPVRLELTGLGDVALGSTAEPFRIGLPGGPNLAADRNEIQARNDGAKADLYLNASGGDIHVGEDFIAANGSVISGVPDVDAGTTGALINKAGGVWSAVRAEDLMNVLLNRNGPADATGQPFVRFGRSNPVQMIGSITIAASDKVAFNTSSDPRLKNNLGPIDDAAERVRTLGAKAFRGTWIGDEGQGQEWDMLSSVDIGTVAPYAVTGEPDAVTDEGVILPQQVDFSSLVPLLVAALSQALDRIAALEAGA